MCACRCGINVHMAEGKVHYIEGNRDHPINKGVLCAKGSAGIMQHYSPARLKKPLLRTGPRGSGEFKEIEWDEALELATGWLGEVRRTDPRKLAFFTGRDQSQSMTGWWAQAFGTPNYAAHGGFCSVNMAAAGIYTMGGAFWEFGAPDWERTELFMIFGVAEDHDSNPIKMGLGKLKERGVKVIGVNPVRTGYNAIADEWLGITPGTDGLLILALIARASPHRQDRSRLSDPLHQRALAGDRRSRRGRSRAFRARRRGRAAGGRPDDRQGDLLCNAGREAGAERPVRAAGRAHASRCSNCWRRNISISNTHPPRWRSGPGSRPTPSPASPANRRGGLRARSGDRAPWTDMKGERHDKMIGRPVAFHAMRGISAHSNGFQTCRALHLLQILLGSIDCPGGFRFKPPYPRPVAGQPRPHGGACADTALAGPHLGYPRGPEDLLLEADGETAQRIDKAFSWDAPLSAHGLMHMVISNAHARDPYGIDVLFMYMANMAWNSSMNTPR
jgi:anaerobic selenocysteine-containing dehydrogenase